MHEHQRPDAEDFIEVDYSRIRGFNDAMNHVSTVVDPRIPANLNGWERMKIV